MNTNQATGSNTLSNRTLVDRANQAIRDNPLAAGLIGVGLFMTFFGSARLPALAAKAPGAVKSAAGAVADTISAGGRSLSEGMTAASDVVANAATKLADNASALANQSFGGEKLAQHSMHASEAIGSGAAELRDRVSAGARSGIAAGMEAGRALQGQFAEQFERQPLLLGAVGLAIGAGIASVLPATDVERELVGEQASALRSDVERRANQLVSELKQEAAAQGFTPSAAKETLEQVARKAKNIASSARDAVGNRVS